MSIGIEIPDCFPKQQIATISAKDMTKKKTIVNKNLCLKIVIKPKPFVACNLKVCPSRSLLTIRLTNTETAIGSMRRFTF